MQKKRLIISTVFIFFLLISIGYLCSLHSFAANYWGWVTGDWFVNYKAGFVRRGLCGYVMMGISDLLKLKLNYTVMCVQSLFYIGYMAILFSLFYKKKITLSFLFLLLSPATLLFPVFDVNASGRKEIILFFLFGLYILYLNKNLAQSAYMIFFFSSALLIATLFHELIFFYTPYFILAAYIKCRIEKKTFQFNKTLLIAAGSCLSIIVIFFFGKPINGLVIYDSLKERGFPDCIRNGALSWPTDYGIKDVVEFAIKSNYLFVYGCTFLLGLLPFIVFIKFLEPPIATIKKFVAILFLLILFSSPLFLLAVDWGRWINIHFMMLLFLSTLFLTERTSGFQSQPADKKIRIPLLWSPKSNFLRLSNILIICLLPIAYVMLWHMPHFGYDPVFTLTGNFYRIKHLSLNIIHTLFN